MCLLCCRHENCLLACRRHGEPHTPLPAAAQRSGSQPSSARRTARAGRGKLASPETPPLKGLRRKPPARRALPPQSRRPRRHRAVEVLAVRLWTRRASRMTWKARCRQSCRQRSLQRTKRCGRCAETRLSTVCLLSQQDPARRDTSCTTSCSANNLQSPGVFQQVREVAARTTALQS